MRTSELEYGASLGEEIRDLRRFRGLSLSGAAALAAMTPGALGNWGNDRRTPRGAAFARLLDALEAPPRQRARLLALTDPAFARVELATDPLGAPVHTGEVLRALRRRAEISQEALALRIGVGQSTVARWETGDSIPDGPTLHAIGFALGASPEEAVTLSCGSDASPHKIPDDPKAASEFLFEVGFNTPSNLREIVSLGWEADLWNRAVRNARWDETLCFVVASRAERYFVQGRLGEAKATARRALRIPQTPAVRIQASFAFSALMEVALYHGADPESIEPRVTQWIEALPDHGIKGWMMWERALRLAETGRESEAVELTERACAMMAWHNLRSTPQSNEPARRGSLVEVYLRTGNARRAAEAMVAVESNQDRRRAIQVAHALGVAAPEAEVAQMKATLKGATWYDRVRAARLERNQARLLGA